MDDQLHIIIAGDRGKVYKVPCSRKKLKNIAIASGVTLLFLVVTSIYCITAVTKGQFSSSEVARLRQELKNSEAIIAEHEKLSAKQKKEMNLKAEELESEKEDLITNAVGELIERTALIEEIVHSLGIKFPKKKSDDNNSNSGGPFIEYNNQSQDELIDRADKYLKTIRRLPLGRPVPGLITSRYGKREDPMNNRAAFHSGIDFRGKKGEKIKATADGTVIKAYRNGGHGNYVKIDHGNGYTTSFSHMKKFFVKRGEKVKRGQVIGLVGSTGRSTGPHLHYEVALDGKTINPLKFLRVSKLLQKK